MSRQPIRDLKRSLSAGALPGAGIEQRQLARDAALALLERSIGFGHARLAVIRLSMAVQAGADVPATHWSYCEHAAAQSRDQDLQALWLAAAAAVGSQTPAVGMAAAH
ncbi:MAG: hypothetical protein RJA98_1765 [Pseudomonadota bacterium]|jgi:hypothetical protein